VWMLNIILRNFGREVRQRLAQLGLFARTFVRGFEHDLERSSGVPSALFTYIIPSSFHRLLPGHYYSRPGIDVSNTEAKNQG
jgi:hypothetical protein